MTPEQDKVLRLDFDALTKNAVWGEFDRHMAERENSYISKLATAVDIAEVSTKGQMWQEMIREIRKLREYPARIISSTEE